MVVACPSLRSPRRAWKGEFSMHPRRFAVKNVPAATMPVLALLAWLVAASPVMADGAEPLLDAQLQSALRGYHADICDWVMTLDVGSGVLNNTDDTPWSVFINGNFARVLMTGAHLHGRQEYLDEALRWCDTFVEQQQLVKTSTGMDGGFWGDHGATGNLYLADSGTAATALALGCRRTDGERREVYLAAMQRFADFVHTGCDEDPQGQGRQPSSGWVIGEGPHEGALGCGYYRGHLSTEPYIIATGVNGGAFMSMLYSITGEKRPMRTASGAVRWILSQRLANGQLPYILDGSQSASWPFNTTTYCTEGIVATATHVDDPQLRSEIISGVEPIIEWLLQSQNEDGTWGAPRSADQQRSPECVVLLAWYYRNADSDARVAEAVRKYCRFLLEPESSEAYGVKSLVRTTGFVGLTVAELLEPELIYR